MLPLNTTGTALDLALTVVFVLVYLTVQLRVGLLAAASFFLTLSTISDSPPLTLDRWYAGRAVIALLIPLAVIVYGFYVSLGGQPLFGTAPNEE
jgi:hypothetical protein